MVGQGQRALRTPHRPPRGRKAGKGLRRRDLVQQVQVDIEQGLAIVLGDGVRIPYLVVKRARAGHNFPSVSFRGPR